MLQLKITDLLTPTARPQLCPGKPSKPERAESQPPPTTFRARALDPGAAQPLQTATSSSSRTQVQIPARTPPSRHVVPSTPTTKPRRALASAENRERVPETPTKRKHRGADYSSDKASPPGVGSAGSISFPDLVEISSGVEDSDCEIQKVFPSPRRRSAMKPDAASPTKGARRTPQPRRRKKLSERDVPRPARESDCAIVKVQQSPLAKPVAKPQVKPVRDGADSECEILQVSPSPKRGQPSLKGKHFSPKNSPQPSPKPHETPEQEPRSEASSGSVEKSVLHVDLTDLATDESDFSEAFEAESDKAFADEPGNSRPQQDAIHSSDSQSEEHMASDSTDNALRPGMEDVQLAETSEPSASPRGSSHQESICKLEDDADCTLPNTQLQLKGELDSDSSPCPFPDSPNESSASLPLDEEPLSSTGIGTPDALANTKLTPGFYFDVSRNTLPMTPQSMPRGRAPYTIRPAYKGETLEMMHRKGLSGKYEPRHRNTIIGLRSILKTLGQTRTDSTPSPAFQCSPSECERQWEARTTVRSQGLSPLKSSGERVSEPDGNGTAKNLLSALVSLRKKSIETEDESDMEHNCTTWLQKAPQCMIRLTRDGVSEHAIKPTVARLQKRIIEGKTFAGASADSLQGQSAWALPQPRPPRGDSAMAAELEHRGIRTGAQYGNFWTNLTMEYSRLAGSSVPLFSMMKKGFDDFQEECMEIRRDLESRGEREEKRENKREPRGLEALLLWGAGDTDEDSPSSSSGDEVLDTDISTREAHVMGLEPDCQPHEQEASRHTPSSSPVDRGASLKRLAPDTSEGHVKERKRLKGTYSTK